MFKAAKDTLTKLMKDPKILGVVETGMTAILHTWGSQMQYHPHIHIIIPGGGLNSQGEWRSFKPGFSVPINAASKMWKGKLLSAMMKKLNLESLPYKIYEKEFIVHAKPMGDGVNAIKYLARYVNRVAISNERITEISDDHISFRYKDKEDREKSKICKLKKHEFMRRYLMHILPKGFVKIRSYGFHHPNSPIRLHELRLKIAESMDKAATQVKREDRELSTEVPPIQPSGIKCPCCGGPMIIVEVHRIKKVPRLYVMTG
jgi:hypothetical protein